jgi:phage tail protein X
MEVEYTLFSNRGIPLRATVELSFIGFRCVEQEHARFPKNSPDMSRLVTVRECETLAWLCHKIYGDSLLVRQLARFNGLNGFRNIPAGTEILFPPLKKQ